MLNFLQAFKYDIFYKNTKLHNDAIALSKLHTKTEDTHLFKTCDVFEIQL